MSGTNRERSKKSDFTASVIADQDVQIPLLQRSYKDRDAEIVEIVDDV